MTDATPKPVAIPPADVPFNALEAMLFAAVAEPARMPEFERALLLSDLYAVPEGDNAPGPDDAGLRVLRGGERMDVRGLTLNTGHTAMAVFTDPRRAPAAFGEDTPFIGMKGRALLNLFLGGHVLINPAEGRGLLLEPERIAALLEAWPEPTDARPSGEVHLGPPEIVPEALLARLRQGFAPEALAGDGAPTIAAAWLARAHWLQSGRWGWLFDVRTDRPQDEIRAMTERAVRGLPFGDDTLDVTATPPGGEDGVGIRVI